MSASLLVVSLSASPILVMMGYLEVGAVVLIMVELVAVVTVYFSEVCPVACMATPRPAIPLDESEWERARLSA